MLTSIRLQNLASFGTLQTAPLEAITVVVGANNSGKTNFLRAAQLVRDGGHNAATRLHRPPTGEGVMLLEWDIGLPPRTIGGKARDGTWTFRFDSHKDLSEETIAVDRVEIFGNRTDYNGGDLRQLVSVDQHNVAQVPGRICAHAGGFFPASGASRQDIDAVMRPIYMSRDVHLKVDSLRAHNQLLPGAAASIQPDGSQLTALLASWALEFPEKLDRFNAFIRACLPEMKRVVVNCPGTGSVQLLFEQTDNEKFTSFQVSEGVVVFAGLIAHALEAPPNALVFIEEPERGIHPRRLGELVDLLRVLVEERQTQFIMATHSPALLNEFRDEPKAILMFRRTPDGTSIQRLSDASPAIQETLRRADPGELLASGAFNEDSH